MNVAGRVWTIPAECMKMNREHRVSLSLRAVEVLDAARSLADGNPLVFPNRRGNRIRDTILSQCPCHADANWPRSRTGPSHGRAG